MRSSPRSASPASSVRARCVMTAIALLSCALPSVARSEDSLGTRDSLERPLPVAERVARLVRLNRRLRLVLDARDSARTVRERAERTVDIDVGALHLRATAMLATAARRAAEATWNELSPRLGAVLDSSLNTERYAVRFNGRVLGPLWLGELEVARLKKGARSFDEYQTTRMSWGTTTERSIAEALHQRISQRATDLLHADVQSWIALSPLPWNHTSREEIATVHRQLAVANMRSVRECLTTSSLRCQRALGLGNEQRASDEGWRDYFDDDELAIALGELRTVSRGGVVPDDLSMRCTSGDVRACHEGAAAAGNALPFPALAQSRRSLVGLALEEGGREAYSRLLGAHGSMRERLELTSGLPIDTLLARWHDRLVAVAPQPPLPVDTALAGLGCSLLLAGVAIHRRRPCA